MSRLEYWSPSSPTPPHPPGPGVFSGPVHAGCFAMLAVTALAAVLALSIVTALGLALG